MARTTITDRHRADQAARLAETDRAHAAAGMGKHGDSVTRAAAFFRSKYSTREVQAVFDELVVQAPGPRTLSLVVALMAAQAAEESRLMRHWRDATARAEKLDKAGDASGAETARQQAAGISEQLQEHRRCTRHLTHSTDAMMRAVKVQSELRLSGAPNAIEVTGTDTARERLTALPQ